MRPFAKLLCPLVVIIARTRKRLVSNAAEVAAHVEVEHLVVLESLREVAGHKHVGDARPLHGRRLQRRRAVHRGRSWTVRRRYLHDTYIDRQIDILLKVKKGKVFPYSLPSVGPGADPGVQAVSPQVT